MQNFKKILLVSTFFSSLVLVGCSDNQLSKTAEEVAKNNITEKDGTKDKDAQNPSTYDEHVKEWKKTYGDPEKSVDESVDEIEREKVGTVSKQKLIVRDSYTDPAEFATYVADIMYKFNTGELSPKEYREFLISFGSGSLQESMLTLDEEIDIQMFKDTQKAMKDTKVQFVGYSISSLTTIHGESGKSFYRKVETEKGKFAYYKTHITEAADGSYKFESDTISVPVDF